MRQIRQSEKLSIVTGALLGDGYARNGRLVIQHSIKQRVYALHKATLISAATGRPFSVKEGVANGFPFIRTSFYKSSLVQRVERAAYSTGKKSVTVGLLNQIDPGGLAIWYLDDGSLTLHRYPGGAVKSREIYWGTECFSLAEHRILVEWMSRRFGFNAKIQRYKRYHRIKMNATNANRLFDIIGPHVPPCMNYKIDMRYAKPPRTRRHASPSPSCEVKI
jgi:hypothetical protein